MKYYAYIGIGIAISAITIIVLISLNYSDKTNNRSLEALTLPSDCKYGTPVPFSDSNKGIYRYLLMRPNSTANICVTFFFNFSWAQYPNSNKIIYPYGLFNVSGLHLPSILFQVTANPSIIDLTNITAGSNVTVLYRIHANPNATGYYSQVVPFNICESYPLAVTDNASQVKLSEFGYIGYNPIHSCFLTIDEYHLVKIISGMNYT